MSELGAEARSLIESARGGDQPSAADRERLRGKLIAELGAAALASAAVASTAASAGATSVPAGASGAASSSGIFGALKLTLAALVVAAVGAGVVLGLRPAPAAKPTAPVTAPEARPVEPAPAPVVTPLADEPTPAAEEPASRPPRARPRTIESKPAAPEAAPAASNPYTLAEELALLSRAQTALRSGQPEQALQLVREHEQRFAQGALVQERLGITALARCALGGDTSQVVNDLSRAAPGSPMLERVREACARK